MIGTPGPGSSKAVWREWSRRQWGTVDSPALSPLVVGHLRQFEPLSGTRTIMIYYPMNRELDLTALGRRRHGSTVMTATRTPADGPLTLHLVGEWPLEEHSYGFLQPTADAPRLDPGEVDVALVPGLCFARDGTRLGHGAGYFDEFLAQLRADAVMIGVAPARLVVERLPRRSHDVAMTHLATELGVSPAYRPG